MFDFLNPREADFLLWIQENIRNPFLDVVFNLITFLGEKGWFFILLAAVLFLLRPTRRIGTAACLSCAYNGIIVNLLLKNIFQRTRPFRLTEFADRLLPAAWIVPGEHSYSFPSGHTAIAFCVFWATLGLLPKKASAVLGVLASLVALSRLYVGVHYPTDVLAGILFAGVAALLARLTVRYFPKKGKDFCNKLLPDMF